MRYFYFLIILSLLIISCGGDDESQPDIGNFVIYGSSHTTSDNLHYPNLAVELSLGTTPIDLGYNHYQIGQADKVEWRIDGELFSERLEPAIVFNSPGTYVISVKGSGIFYDGTFTTEVESAFEATRTFEVVEQPYIYGSIETPENAVFAWINEDATLSILLTEDYNDEKVLVLNESFEEEVFDFNPGYSFDVNDIRESFVDDDNHLVFNTYRSLVTLSKSGETLSRVYLQNDIDDLIPSGESILALLDSYSTPHKFVVTVDRATETFTTDEFLIEVDNYTHYQSYFASESSFFTFLTETDGTSNINLLSGLTLSNENFLNHYKENLYINNIWPVSDGWLISSPNSDDTIDGKLLTMLSPSGTIEWSISTYTRSTGSSIDLLEQDNHYYVFLDNLRVIKMTKEGGIVWDHYYYGSNSIFHAVTEKNGLFYLVGSRQIDPITKTPSYDSRDRDLVVIVVDQDGNIVH
ncbi:hypothetical protein [Ekhidna sp. To15]|uniref:hypothetical protein n=1 Tax=Ekhidna sp. To15 TaxID=3395267 RepID=UPI003F51FAF0